MSWVVLRQFADSQDDYRVYRVGDLFPRPGKAVTQTRIAELSKLEFIAAKAPKEPKIEKVEVEKKPEPIAKKKTVSKKKTG